MTDTVTPDIRSRVMSRVRSRNTGPEMYVRRCVWSEGFRYRLNVKKLPGRPDMVFARYRLAVFVHGCFWHQHDCPNAKRPSSNRDYWDRKLDGNMERDSRNRAKLEGLGWTVATVWECNLQASTEALLSRLKCLRSEGLPSPV